MICDLCGRDPRNAHAPACPVPHMDRLEARIAKLERQVKRLRHPKDAKADHEGEVLRAVRSGLAQTNSQSVCSDGQPQAIEAIPNLRSQQ